MLKVVPSNPDREKEFQWSLDEIARQGARRLLIEALNLEVEEYINHNSKEVDENGNRLVVRNGVSKSRSVTMGSGTVEVQCPRVNDRRDGEKFLS
jgi:putative transposase